MDNQVKDAFVRIKSCTFAFMKRTIALGIQSTNDCTYTRTSNIVNRNPRTLYFFQNSYCCSPFGTTSTQHKSHLQAELLYRFLLSLYGKTTTDKDKKYKKCTNALDTLFRSQHWLALLSDRDTTLTGKVLKEVDGVTYLFGFPVRRKAVVERKKGWGLSHGDHIYDFLDSLVSHSPAEKGVVKCTIPFSCVAFDIRRRQEIILDTGNLARNMRASMAIPGMFKPVAMDTLMLVDGGMINNLPVDVMRRMGADIVIAIDLQQRKHDDYHSPFAFLRGLGGVFSWLAERPDIKKYNINRTQADLYINPNLGSYGVTDFKPGAIKDMIRIGEETGKAYRNELKRMKEKLSKGR